MWECLECFFFYTFIFCENVPLIFNDWKIQWHLKTKFRTLSIDFIINISNNIDLMWWELLVFHSISSILHREKKKNKRLCVTMKAQKEWEKGQNSKGQAWQKKVPPQRKNWRNWKKREKTFGLKKRELKTGLCEKVEKWKEYLSLFLNVSASFVPIIWYTICQIQCDCKWSLFAAHSASYIPCDFHSTIDTTCYTYTTTWIFSIFVNYYHYL